MQLHTLQSSCKHGYQHCLPHTCYETVITADHMRLVLCALAAAEIIATFLRAASHNLRYTGIDVLARMVRLNPKYAAEHQLAVIDCLEDPDPTLKKKTLELLFKMAKPNNVEVRSLGSMRQAPVHQYADCQT